MRGYTHYPAPVSPGVLSLVPANVREMAMILTAREMDCHFIRNVHAAFDRQSGLSEELVSNLSDKRELRPLSAENSSVVNYGRELFCTRKVNQANYDPDNITEAPLPI